MRRRPPPSGYRSAPSAPGLLGRGANSPAQSPTPTSLSRPSSAPNRPMPERNTQMDPLLALRDVGIVAPQPDDAGDRLIRTALDREIARGSRSASGDAGKARRRARRV